MFHANRWHSDFATPMIVYKSEHIFVNDFVFINYGQNTAFAKVLKYFQMVMVNLVIFTLNA